MPDVNANSNLVESTWHREIIDGTEIRNFVEVAIA